ncbi:hypothetical protein [Virgibacillus sp. DJP39]|uniref:hypothetical protein n=1 Tax=Virgibacillus sp. DJP39 TaxID=3409790 RepID=UPI003BB7B9B6
MKKSKVLLLMFGLLLMVGLIGCNEKVEVEKNEEKELVVEKQPEAMEDEKVENDKKEVKKTEEVVKTKEKKEEVKENEVKEEVKELSTLDMVKKVYGNEYQVTKNDIGSLVVTKNGNFVSVYKDKNFAIAIDTESFKKASEFLVKLDGSLSKESILNDLNQVKKEGKDFSDKGVNYSVKENKVFINW